MSFCLANIADDMNDGIAPGERACFSLIHLRRFAVDSDLGIPVGEVHAETVRMAMTRLDGSRRDMHVEDSHKRVLERDLVRVRRDLHRIQGIVLRANADEGSDDECRRRRGHDESVSIHDCHSLNALFASYWLAESAVTFSRSVISLALLALVASPVAAADLQPRTVAAFDRYVRAAEAQMVPEPFLRLDALAETERREKLAALKHGGLYIERLSAREAGKKIDVPDGLMHHWLGAAFVPGATLRQAVDLLQDYNRHAEIFRPAIARSKLVSRTGDTFRVDLRFYMKKVITVVVDTENEARFTHPAPDRAQSRIYSLRIAEVADPDTPKEHQRPPGHDGGYLWRLYTYWRFLERDGGTYVQCEAISLTRSIPAMFGWLIGPFVSSIPRESLAFTLEATRKTLAARR